MSTNIDELKKTISAYEITA